MALKDKHDLNTAGRLYLSLAFCTYALISLSSLHVASPEGSLPTEETEQRFQRALSLALQSSTLFQAGGDRSREASARLLRAAIELDLSRWRMSQQQCRDAEPRSSSDETPLLDDVEEQCRQVLLGWQDPPGPGEASSDEVETTIYTALVCLIRTAVQRAIRARSTGNALDRAYRERAFAAFLCQQVLATLAADALPWAMIEEAVKVSADTLPYRSPTPPRFRAMTIKPGCSRAPLSLVEVSFAAGEVAEELGRAAGVKDYARDCYTQADHWFQAALSGARALVLNGDQDPGYLFRLSGRCLTLLQERLAAAPEMQEETTALLLRLLTSCLQDCQKPVSKDTVPAPREAGYE
jgi:hypothetical protein